MLIAQNLNEIQEASGVKLKFNDVGGFVGEAVWYVFGFAGILLLVYMVAGGLQLMTSGGDPKAMQSAQGKITNALLGFVIILVSAGVVVLLGRILNIDVFSNLF
jgi:hypothetical protein